MEFNFERSPDIIPFPPHKIDGAIGIIIRTSTIKQLEVAMKKVRNICNYHGHFPDILRNAMNNQEKKLILTQNQ